MEPLVLPRPLNTYIDHTLLKPTATDAQFEQLVDEAMKYQFASVCVSPYIASSIASVLKYSADIKTCTVVGFPHGNTPLLFKMREVEYFIKKQVKEIDFVLHYGEVLNGKWNNVKLEINSIGRMCADAGVVSKCIVEICYLSPIQQMAVFDIIRQSPVDFIKTSTGYGDSGASLEVVKMWHEMRQGLERPYIKAAGGIKDLTTSLAFIEAGADRLGMSASVKVMEEYNQKLVEGGL